MPRHTAGARFAVRGEIRCSFARERLAFTRSNTGVLVVGASRWLIERPGVAADLLLAKQQFERSGTVKSPAPCGFLIAFGEYACIEVDADDDRTNHPRLLNRQQSLYLSGRPLELCSFVSDKWDTHATRYKVLQAKKLTARQEMGFFGWWSDLPTWLRYGTAIVFLLISTVLWFGGSFWPWGWVVGIVLLLMAGPSKAEKKGYHDF